LERGWLRFGMIKKIFRIA